jgi:hypothetical protein
MRHMYGVPWSFVVYLDRTSGKSPDRDIYRQARAWHPSAIWIRLVYVAPRHLMCILEA